MTQSIIHTGDLQHQGNVVKGQGRQDRLDGLWNDMSEAYEAYMADPSKENDDRWREATEAYGEELTARDETIAPTFGLGD